MSSRRRVANSVHTATRPYRCTICLEDIEPGQRYTRRRRRYTRGDYVTIYKCAKCQPLGAEND